MSEAWKHLHGQVADGKFPLQEYIGGSEQGAVFITQRPGASASKAAIKLVPADLRRAERRLERWKAASRLSHPHLVQLFETGRCRIEDGDFIYVVMEHAEENLSEVLAERPLTAEETREMLPPVLEALSYLHGKGWVHGRLQPANILAVEDRLKLSSEECHRPEPGIPPLTEPTIYDAPEVPEQGLTAAADMWSLGMTVVDALTRQLPVWQSADHEEPGLPELPEPFPDIALHCLKRDPGGRWNAAEVASRLGVASPPPLEQSRVPARTRRFLAIASIAAIVALAATLVATAVFRRPAETPQAPISATPPPQIPTPPKPEPAPERKPPIEPAKSAERGSREARREAAVARPATPGDVVKQVLPNIPDKARNTISGSVTVAVRLRVDPSGQVTNASLDSAGSSRYFAQRALEASRQWRFRPGPSGRPSEWLVQFEFRRSGTEARPTRVAP
ncbi:MAG: TonB family protein [Bryobacteraceae bacterium]|nr:TonB family protein [Bryobacteraceae bacterium]